MAFLYSQDVAVSLLRDLAEKHGQACADRERERIPAQKLLVLERLIAKLHHAGGEKTLRYGWEAHVSFLPNSRSYAKCVDYGVSLGLVEKGPVLKLADGERYSTTGVMLRLTEKGSELCKWAGSEQGRAEGLSCLQAGVPQRGRINWGRLPQTETYADIPRNIPRYAQVLPASYTGDNDTPLSGERHTFKHENDTPLSPENALKVCSSRDGLETLEETIGNTRTKSETASVSNDTRDITAIRTTLEAALRRFNRKQGELGGPISDQQTLGSLMQVTFKRDLSAEQVAAACDDADDLTYAWHWSQGRPSPYDAGRCLCAALKGDLRDELEPGINCSPDLESEQEQPQEAPAALDKGEQPYTPSHAATTALQGHTDATQVAIAPHTPTYPDRPLVPAVAQIAEQRKERHETIETQRGMNAEQVQAVKEAALRDFPRPAEHSPGRYGTPPEALTHTQAA